MGVLLLGYAHPTPSAMPLIFRRAGKTGTSLCGSGYEQVTPARTADRLHAAQLMLGAFRGA